MLQKVKRACALCLVLVMVLLALPQSAFRVYAEEESKANTTMVQHNLNFTLMNRIAEGRDNEKQKAKVRDALLAAGAVECENLYLAGNYETIVNPGGYQHAGYYVQKVSAVEGETIETATVNLGYWICDKNESDPNAEQGYVQIWVSTDNVNYELVWEDNEGNGPAFNHSRKTASVELPVVDGQTDIYVKYVMEHWNTYEGAGVAYSTVTLNVSERPVETDKQPHELTMVTGNYIFNTLNKGEVTAADIGAIEESNLFFGIDDMPLLSPRNGYELSSATWLLKAADGEPLTDCVVTITGRTWWIDEKVKDQNYLKVYASFDGINYKQVHEFRSTDIDDDTQRFVVDVTDVVKGYAKAYIKLEWMVFDSPHIFGIRSVNIVGNTVGIDPSGENNRMAVSNVHSFTSLPVGKVDAATLGAEKSANVMFGYNKTPLLTPCEAGEDAYITWKLSTPEGETFANCYLTLIGKVGYLDENLKNTTKLTVYISTDKGDSYQKIEEFVPNEDLSDKREMVLDLSAQTMGLSEVLVRVYMSTKDDPSCLGLRCMALVGNADAAYPEFTPPLEDRVITDEEMGIQSPTEPEATEPTQNPPVDEPADGSWIIYVAVAAVVVAAVVVAVIVIGKKKKKQ